MTGLRERKKRATRAAIRDAGMRLFARQGFAATTIEQIAEAAEVSRATVFSYFPTKEEIVFGDAASAIDALASTLRQGAADGGVIAAVRAWLGGLAGWIEPELALQLQLARDVATVGARRLQLHGEVQRVVAEALEAELGADRHLAAQLAAASLVAAVGVAEEAAAARMAAEGRALTPAEIEPLFDDAVAFARAGMAAIGRDADASGRA